MLSLTFIIPFCYTYGMDIVQMEYIVKVADERNITRAAERLHISQPALSRAIARIESNLGVAVFRREGKQLVLTEMGSHVYTWAKETLTSYIQLNETIHPHGDGERQILRITCSGNVFARNIIIPFLKDNPDINIVDFEFRLNAYPDIINTVDCALSVKDFHGDDIQSFVMYKSPLYVTLPSHHPLAHREKVSLKDLKEERFIISRTDTVFYEQVEDMFRRIGGYFHVGTIVEKEHMLHMLREGIGASITMIEGADFVTGSPDAVARPLAEDFCFMNVYFAYKIQPEYSSAFKKFRSYAQKYKHKALERS